MEHAKQAVEAVAEAYAVVAEACAVAAAGDAAPGLLMHLQRKSASSHGDGVFAKCFIPRGSYVLTMTGRVMPAAQVTDAMRAMQIDHGHYLVEAIAPGDDGSELQYIDNYLNHSCSPNVGFIHGDLRLIALVDIQPGQQLCWDYSTSMNEPGWAMRCLCESPDCRGVVHSFCDLAPAAQAKLRPLALKYLRDAEAIHQGKIH